MKASYKFFLRIFLLLIAFYLFASYFTDIAVYVAVSMILTTILLPLIERLVHVSVLGVQLSRTLAAFLSFLLLMCVCSVFVSMFVPLVKEQIDTIAAINGGEFESRLRLVVLKLENSKT